MSKYLSSKLTVLYTVLIVMVVYIHSYYSEAEEYPIVLFVQNLIGPGICRIANCLFFCISGYLFARNINSIKDVLNKRKKRFKTLVLPYVLWNLIFVLWYVALENIPIINDFCNSSGTLEKYLNQPFIKSLSDLFIAPAAFQLWFVRDLLVMLLISPIIWWISRKYWIVALIMALATVAIYPWMIYFWLGIIVAVQKWDVENYPHSLWGSIISGIVFLGYAVYLALGYKGSNLVEVPINLIGIYLIWCSYDLIVKGKCIANRGLWKYVCGYSFFIYCFHEPTFNIIKKLALYIGGTNELVLILAYLINPLIMVAVSICVAKILQHISPWTYKLLTGGR